MSDRSVSHCTHGFSYAGPAGAAKPGSGCERPVKLTCRCGLSVVADCQTSRSRSCGPCGQIYRDRVRRLARVPAGGVLLLTFTAPGVPGHMRNVGGKRVQRQAGGKRHTHWQGGRWVKCDCWRAITEAGGLGGWNAGLGARWNRLVNDGIRAVPHRAWAAGAYFKATEPQERGALHVHVLVRVPAGFDLTDAMVDDLAAAAEHYGFGHVADAQVVESHRAAGYVAKYVSKAADDRPGVPWRRLKTRPASQRFERNPHLSDAERQLLAPLLPSPADRDVTFVSTRATYRTWTVSRDWPHSMRALREAQAHYAAVMAVAGRMVLHDPAGHSDVEVLDYLAELVPFRPDLPWDPFTGEVLGIVPT